MVEEIVAMSQFLGMPPSDVLAMDLRTYNINRRILARYGEIQKMKSKR